MKSVLPMVWGALMLVACGSGAEPEGLDARVDGLVAQWQTDPERAVESVVAMEDPVEQLAVVDRLSRRLPAQLGELCARLPAGGAAAHRCSAVDARPHLGEQRTRERAVPQPGAPQSGRPPGPASPTLLSLGLDLPPSTLVALPAPPNPCATAPTPGLCRRRRAEGALRAGALGDALGLCREEQPGVWGDECVFQLAERLLQGPPQQVPLSTVQELCLQAGDLAENCLGHVVLAVSRVAPAADEQDDSAWAQVVQLATGLRANWSTPEREAVGEQLTDLLWSESMRHAYARAHQPTGLPLGAVPAAVAPHARAAIAVMVVAQAPPDTSLPELAQAVLLAEARRTPRTGEAVGTAPDARPDVRLSAQAPAPLGTRLGFYLGMGRRYVAEDVEEDAIICVLEAAATQSPPRLDLLEAGLRVDTVSVRATSARLLDALRSVQAASAGGSAVSDPGTGQRPQ